MEGNTANKSRPTLQERMVGPSNESKVKVCGEETVCLMDSGSMVTTISEEFYNSL